MRKDISEQGKKSKQQPRSKPKETKEHVRKRQEPPEENLRKSFRSKDRRNRRPQDTDRKNNEPSMFAAADHDRNCNFSDGKKWEHIYKKT